MPTKLFKYMPMILALPAVQALATPVEKKDYLRGGVPALSCTVQIDFGSAANGPDMDAWSAIRTYIAGSSDIAKAEAWGWGKEGEFSLCLTADDEPTGRKLFDDIAKLTPPAPAANGAWTKASYATSAKRP